MLSTPTRRKVLEYLSVGRATASEPAAPFDMQLSSFVQHLSVLEESRLVRSTGRPAPARPLTSNKSRNVRDSFCGPQAPVRRRCG
ncbi:MAG TPA: helix-turn-helix domain-containing protein [Gemmatimonadales bacterium]|nr:helix-turn-helix domain-containing protein [Gemmatimonadales bacterium]